MVKSSQLLAESHGPLGGSDLHFNSPQPDTSLHCKWDTDTRASALYGVSSAVLWSRDEGVDTRVHFTKVSVLVTRAECQRLIHRRMQHILLVNIASTQKPDTWHSPSLWTWTTVSTMMQLFQCWLFFRKNALHYWCRTSLFFSDCFR